MKLKTTLPLCAGLLFSATSFSQNFKALVQPESKWINEVSEYELKDGYNRVQKKFMAADAYCILASDSIIGGETFNKVDDCTGNYVGAISEEEGKVYLITKGSGTKRIIYDFSVQAGDTIKNVLIKDKLSHTNYNIHTVIVKSVDSVEIYGEVRKRINFANASWIEGIGNATGFLNGHYVNDLRYSFELKCMSRGNVSLYPQNQGEACDLPVNLRVDSRKITELIYPKVSKDKFVMEFDRRIDQDEIYIINEEGEIIQPAMNVELAKVEVDLSSFSSGNYMVLMRSDNKLALGRMVKI